MKYLLFLMGGACILLISMFVFYCLFTLRKSEICGFCKHYNSDTCFCDEHPVYGKLVEQDTCSDWSEDDTIPK